MPRQVSITENDERIIQVLATYRKPMTPTEIGDHLKITKTGARGSPILKTEKRRTFYNSLKKLTNMRIISQLQDSNRYVLVLRNVISANVIVGALYWRIIRGTIQMREEDPDISEKEILRNLNLVTPWINIPYVVDEIVHLFHPDTPSLVEQFGYMDSLGPDFWHDIIDEYDFFPSA